MTGEWRKDSNFIRKTRCIEQQNMCALCFCFSYFTNFSHIILLSTNCLVVVSRKTKYQAEQTKMQLSVTLMWKMKRLSLIGASARTLKVTWLFHRMNNIFSAEFIFSFDINFKTPTTTEKIDWVHWLQMQWSEENRQMYWWNWTLNWAKRMGFLFRLLNKLNQRMWNMMRFLW